jgi:hypothetical protein
MKRPALSETDIMVRLGGLALLLLSVALFAALPGPHAGHGAHPTAADFCIAFGVVGSGCVGASFLFMGRQLFEPVRSRYELPPDEGSASQDERR